MIKRVLWGVVVLAIILLGIVFLYLKSELPKYREAFLYAYGPYEFARSTQEMSAQRDADGGIFTTDSIREAYPEWSQGAFLNRHLHNTRLADHTVRTVTTPNNDTFYTSAVLELSSTPVELILPDVGERYLSIALMDAFTDQFDHIGPRETGGQGGVYWIVGPNDNVNAPNGVKVIRATSNDVWLLARVFVSGRSDTEAARTAQQGIIVRPVFPNRNPKPYTTPVTEISDSTNFVAVVNEVLARNPNHPQSPRAGGFAALGLGAGAEAGPVSRFIWSIITPRAEAEIIKQVNQQLSTQTGWSEPPRNMGFYGDDDVTRSGIALFGFGALRRRDAIYYRMTKTEDGAILDGAQQYTMTLPPDVPAQAFWSIALYEPDENGRYYLYDNPTGRYSLNSGSEGLSVDEDGSVVLRFSPDKPSDQAINWMPTPDGPFAAFFRVYLPNDQAVSDGWTPPAITRH